VIDKTGSLPVSFPVQIIYRIVSYNDIYTINLYSAETQKVSNALYLSIGTLDTQ